MTLKIDTERIINKIIRTVIRFPAKWYCNYQFKKTFTDNYDTFWVVDIDNTIADSWKKMPPYCNTRFNSQNDRFLAIEPFETMQQLFKHIPPRTRVVFLSARQYSRYFVTKKWLKKHGFWQTDSYLVLVERMKDKVPLLESVLKNYFEKKKFPQYLAHFTKPSAFTKDKKLNDLIIRKYVTPAYPIFYFDDLSYNHEYGNVLFYQDVLDAVQQMPITYIDYYDLITLQSNN
jgi:hypothetical protein